VLFLCIFVAVASKHRPMVHARLAGVVGFAAAHFHLPDADALLILFRAWLISWDMAAPAHQHLRHHAIVRRPTFQWKVTGEHLVSERKDILRTDHNTHPPGLFHRPDAVLARAHRLSSVDR